METFLKIIFIILILFSFSLSDLELKRRIKRSKHEESNDGNCLDDDDFWKACKGCTKICNTAEEFSRHVSHAKKCKEHYGPTFKKWKNDREKRAKSDQNKQQYEEHKDQRKEYYEEHKEQRKEYYEEHKEQRKEYYEKNKEKILDQQSKYQAKQKVYIRNRQKFYNFKLKNDEFGKRFIKFKEETKDGPVFVCNCCRRTLFKKSVQILERISDLELRKSIEEQDFSKNDRRKRKKKWYIENFLEQAGKDLVAKATANTVNNESQVATFCHSCMANLKKRKVPKISISNGMELDEVPEELADATDLEQQLFARMLVFLKIFPLPKNRMKGQVGKMINVPLEESDISNTLKTLPRGLDESALVPLRLKKMKKLKNAYAEAFVRPAVCIKAVQKLKSLKNPHYKDVEISSNFMENKNVGEDSGNPKDQESEDEESGNEDVEILSSVKEHQSDQQENTCLIREDLASLVVENTSKETKNVRKRGKVISISPGENKIPDFFLADKHFDTKAFPCLHPTGKFGLNFPRAQKISPQKYFEQRILNENGMFAKCFPYLFMASQFVERDKLQKEINVSGIKGALGSDSKIRQLSDSFSVFKNISGSPKFWQVKRQELTAKVQQLGVFHVFFTLSCAEMRWAEVYLSILQILGIENLEIRYGRNGDWNGTENDILVNGLPFWDYLASRKDTNNQLLMNYIGKHSQTMGTDF